MMSNYFGGRLKLLAHPILKMLICHSIGSFMFQSDFYQEDIEETNFLWMLPSKNVVGA